MPRKLLAEALGTFALVFAGTAAIAANELTGAITHVGVALTFGLVVFALISALGDISGAHLNPAVTLGFTLAGRFPARNAFAYIASQLLGAAVASVLVWQLFPNSLGLGGTHPSGTNSQSWILELLLTAGLMLTILGVTVGAKEKGLTAGLAIGAVVALEALFAGPICGASMNPARSFGPAIISWQLGHLWIYLTAPTVGAAVAVPVCRALRGKECCPNPKWNLAA